MSLYWLNKLIESLVWNWEKAPISVVKILGKFEEIRQVAKIS
jgi:hypothetical protein